MLAKAEPTALLWRKDGARYGRIDARIVDDGALEIRRHEMGAADMAEWGADDHEATLRVEARDVAKLLLALLEDGYAGRADAMQAVRELCETRDIPAKFAVWT
jgi:hypothetical protein